MIKMDIPVPLNIYSALGQRERLQLSGNTRGPLSMSYKTDSRSP